MTECVILFRIHETGRVGALRDDKGEIAVFANHDEAIRVCFEAEAEEPDSDPLITYQVVLLDEL